MTHKIRAGLSLTEWESGFCVFYGNYGRILNIAGTYDIMKKTYNFSLCILHYEF